MPKCITFYIFTTSFRIKSDWKILQHLKKITRKPFWYMAKNNTLGLGLGEQI